MWYLWRQLSIAALVLQAACLTEPQPPVHWVIPDGFSGEVRLVLDEGDGEEIPLEGERYVIRIPRSGVLSVKSFAPLIGWHEETASYASGRALPVAGSSTPDDAVALRSAFGEPDVLYYVVGTQRDVEALEVPPRERPILPGPDTSSTSSGER